MIDHSEILEKVRQSAQRLGSCDPNWLKSGQVPEFSMLGVDPLVRPPDPAGSEKPELLLLHGLFGALSNWNTVMPLMTNYSHPLGLHFPILTGHRSEVRVKALAAFAEYFIRSRKMQPVAICGNSLGGHVAMRLCLSSPEMVDCLILSGTSGLYEHSVDSLPVRPDERFVREHMGRVFFQKQFITDEAVNEMTAILAQRTKVINLIHAARSAKKDNLLKLLKYIQVPVLLVWGEDDVVTTMDVAKTFKNNLPNATLVTIKNCGHAPMIEYPQWFSGVVEEFLKKNSRYYKK